MQPQEQRLEIAPPNKKLQASCFSASLVSDAGKGVTLLSSRLKLIGPLLEPSRCNGCYSSMLGGPLLEGSAQLAQGTAQLSSQDQ